MWGRKTPSSRSAEVKPPQPPPRVFGPGRQQVGHEGVEALPGVGRLGAQQVGEVVEGDVVEGDGAAFTVQGGHPLGGQMPWPVIEGALPDMRQQAAAREQFDRPRVPARGERDDDVDRGQAAADDRHGALGRHLRQRAGQRVRIGHEAGGSAEVVVVLGRPRSHAQGRVIGFVLLPVLGAQHQPVTGAGHRGDAGGEHTYVPAPLAQHRQRRFGGVLQIVAVERAGNQRLPQQAVEVGGATLAQPGRVVPGIQVADRHEGGWGVDQHRAPAAVRDRKGAPTRTCRCRSGRSGRTAAGS